MGGASFTANGSKEDRKVATRPAPVLLRTFRPQRRWMATRAGERGIVFSITMHSDCATQLARLASVTYFLSPVEVGFSYKK